MSGHLSPSELAALSRRYRPPLIAFFVRRLGDHSRAEDLTQELFARLAAMPEKDIPHLEGYIFQMAANLIRDSSRREKVRTAVSNAIRTDEARDIEWLDAERIVLARESIAQLSVILDSLPERTRTILILFRLESMPRKNIADAFGISISAVDKHLGRAMEILMSVYGRSDDR
ncbi:sigma-70 family RNA polymerase sigma factor (plasmid) [Asticcacaulis sp. DW145]|uniref:RNA polymerase sigma factor n=1 Tax=Asticcacaulis sp. DW145 TaxID=3095608 RepID=UPI00308A9E93|nr:sigma-70 family RNA polymerase sigma factor [Asticcacaulis sp. DW145]